MLRVFKTPQLVRLKTRGESICPVSKTVDVFDVAVEYVPKGSVLSIEEFKQMVDSYRGREILHEELAVELLEKIKSVTNAPYVRVTLRSTHIGVEIEVVAETGGTQPLYI